MIGPNIARCALEGSAALVVLAILAVWVWGLR